MQLVLWEKILAKAVCMNMNDCVNERAIKRANQCAPGVISREATHA